MRLRWLWLVVWLGWVSSAGAAPVSTTVRTATAAELAAMAPASYTGKTYLIRDALDENSCTTGGGTYENYCQSTGAAWAVIPVSGATAGGQTNPEADKVPRSYGTAKIDKGWVPDFIGSGATHASGGVPDPGAAAGTSKYLREDATWNQLQCSDLSGVAASCATDTTNATNITSGALATSQGGTGNAFTKFSGPTTAEKTFTLPDASATLGYFSGTPGTGFVTKSDATGLVSASAISTGYTKERRGSGYATADALIAAHAAAVLLDPTLTEQAVIDSSLACTTKPCTFPATLALDFHGGDLNCQSTTNAFVVLSPILPTKKKIFTNCGSSGSTPLVSFAGNAKVAEIPSAWFGDTGDGTTNDQVFIRDALLAAQSCTGGCTVKVGSGTHSLTAVLTLWGNGVTLAGEGHDATVLLADVNGALAAGTVGGGTTTNRFTLRDLTVRVATGRTNPIQFGSVQSEVTVDNIAVDLSNCATSGCTAIIISGSNNATIKNSLFYTDGDALGQAISIQAGANHFSFLNNRCEYVISCIGSSLTTATGDVFDVHIFDNFMDGGWLWLKPMGIYHNSGATVSYNQSAGKSSILTDSATTFTGSGIFPTQYVRILPVRQQNLAAAANWTFTNNQLTDSNAKFLAQTSATGSITAAGTTLTIGETTFVAADVGKYIAITGAGAGGGVLATTIASFTSTTQVEVTDAAGTTVTGTGAVTWGGVKRGDIVRTPTVSPTKFAIVQKVISNTVLNLEGWRDMTTYRPAIQPLGLNAASTYTVYGLWFESAATLGTNTITGGNYFHDFYGAAVLPAPGTLYEVVDPAAANQIFMDSGTHGVVIRGNTVIRGHGDQMALQSATGVEVSNNLIEDGQDMGITVNGQYVQILGNTISHQGTSAIWMPAMDSLVANNTVRDNHYNALTTGSALGGIEISGERNVITGNVMERGLSASTLDSGLILVNQGIHSPTGNIITNNSTYGYSSGRPGLVFFQGPNLTGTRFGINNFDTIGTAGAGTITGGGIWNDTGTFAFASLPAPIEDGSRLYTTGTDGDCTTTGSYNQYCVRKHGVWAAESTQVGPNGQRIAFLQNSMQQDMSSPEFVGLIPAGAQNASVTCRVTTALTGTLTSYDVGPSGGTTDLFCNDAAKTLNAVCDSTTARGTATALPTYPAAQNVTVTPNGGTLTGGVLRCTANYTSVTAATG